VEGKQENTLDPVGCLVTRYASGGTPTSGIGIRPPHYFSLTPAAALTTICLDIDVLLDSEGRNEWYFHRWLQCLCDAYIKDPSGVHISGACRDGACIMMSVSPDSTPPTGPVTNRARSRPVPSFKGLVSSKPRAYLLHLHLRWRS